MSEKKVLYFDVETTGLDPVKHDIIQIAGLIEINGEVKEEFEFKVRPLGKEEDISQEALDIHGYTLDVIREFPEARETYNKLTALFGKHIDKYNKMDKFTPAGYNAEFDMNFLKEFFNKNNDVYFGSWVNWKKVDPLPILYFLDYAGRIKLENYKLATVAAHFGIELNAHDALSDIKATKAILTNLKVKFLAEEEVVF
jgi:DNA polymerase-3 subunit epsilon